MQIRWLIKADMRQVSQIERDSFEFPWTWRDFSSVLKVRNCIGMVIEEPGGPILGYMIYELHRSHLSLLTCAVHPDHRRGGVGGRLIGKMIDKLSSQRRWRIVTRVRESNVVAQQFFRAMGFRAVSIERNAYAETDDSAYVMEYALPLDECSDDVIAERSAMVQGWRREC